MTAVLVLVSVLLLLGVIALVAVLVLRRVRAASEAVVARNFAPGTVLRSDPVANWFGLESKGGRQIRGNGALVLTAERLWFLRAGATEPVEIPLAAVTAVDTTRSHAGKSVGRDLLRVRFGADSAAWYVRDPGGWQARIAALLPR